MLEVNITESMWCHRIKIEKVSTSHTKPSIQNTGKTKVIDSIWAKVREDSEFEQDYLHSVIDECDINEILHLKFTYTIFQTPKSTLFLCGKNILPSNQQYLKLESGCLALTGFTVGQNERESYKDSWTSQMLSLKFQLPQNLSNSGFTLNLSLRVVWKLNWKEKVWMIRVDADHEPNSGRTVQ